MKRGGSRGRELRSPKRARGARPSSAPVRDDGSDEGYNRGGGGGYHGDDWSDRGGGGGGGNQGRIISFNRQKGFGFISSPDASSDIFMGDRAMARELLDLHDLKGVEVTFDLGWKDDGKPRADNVQMLGGGRGGPRPPSPPRSDGGGQRLGIGRIVRFEEAKGFGFIEPDDRGEDVFFLRGELPLEMANCTRKDQLVDARVEYEVFEKADGKLRARNMGLISPPPGFGGGGGGGRGGGAGSSGSGGDRVVGRIVRYDRQRGYGFIQSQNAPEDIFFLPSTLPPELHERLQRDDIIGIDVEVDMVYKEGKPRAARIGPPPRPGGGGCMGARVPVGGPFATGMIISFDATKGFGFIKPDQPGEDIFYLRGELPPEIREMNKEGIVERRVEFEVKTMPDGKLRALRCRLIPIAMPHGPPMPPHMPPLGPGMRMGRIQRFDRQKGYGFIETPGEKDVFFLPSALPKEMKESGEKLDGLEVGFEFYINEEGKPRAQNVVPLPRGGLPPPPMPHMMPPPPMMNMMAAMMGLPPPMGPMGPMGPPMGMPPMGPPMMDHAPARFRPGQVLTGLILRFNPNKGYGFLAPDGFDEDIFFLRSELPEDIRLAQDKDQVINRRVEFEVRTMPDGKLRAQRMRLCKDQSGGGRRRGRGGADGGGDGGDDVLPPLDPALVDEMVDFLSAEGGGFDFSRFCNKFPKVKKSQLEEHFDIFSLEKGQRIELPRGHPARPDGDDDAPMDEEDGIAGEEDFGAKREDDMAGDEDADGDDVAPDEPAIPPSAGCQPQGWIRTYDPTKGFGFVKCEGLEEDIFFPRSSLPEAFHAKKRNQMPELQGVEVSVELGPSGDRGPRASRLTLLLKWHAGDSCWLLKRRPSAAN